mmetsp:Transcript_3758/g.10806  ORF Transcript_3758/g.10806 Transcript_3758/m.10806 type:complete len:247 (-) Transcript_3758:1400-2140(-)|eukprot:CAMPEP_0118861274 /NCGR_PEP_ID=MMETSP1163-20130328/6861_1 /TAXON_ID=124430 /ORGANISM="Phaeomonas parva, Strain CCMP2877" /LENGTH=246 /DNA_ID=CAMNT_0006795077 /DNA_START=56 /DNA_END=796 /DNA_ORIENTATION=+
MAASEPEETVLFGLMTAACWDTMVAQGDLLDVDCLKMLAAKGIGVALILGSMMVRVPQIVAIHRGGGVEGLSITSIYMDVPTYLLSALYYFLQGSPFSAWGEIANLLLQSLIILGQCWYYRRAGMAEIGLAALAFGGIVAGAHALPAELRGWLLLATVPVNSLSRGGQVLTNLQQGHTGRLSIITTTLNFLGAAARVFTTAVEVQGDLTAMATVCIATFWNGVLFAQILAYRSATKAALDKDKKEA